MRGLVLDLGEKRAEVAPRFLAENLSICHGSTVAQLARLV
jgi:hypothetical protein